MQPMLYTLLGNVLPHSHWLQVRYLKNLYFVITKPFMNGRITYPSDGA